MVKMFWKCFNFMRKIVTIFWKIVTTFSEVSEISRIVVCQIIIGCGNGRALLPLAPCTSMHSRSQLALHVWFAIAEPSKVRSWECVGNIRSPCAAKWLFLSLSIMGALHASKLTWNFHNIDIVLHIVMSFVASRLEASPTSSNPCTLQLGTYTQPQPLGHTLG